MCSLDSFSISQLNSSVSYHHSIPLIVAALPSSILNRFNFTMKLTSQGVHNMSWLRFHYTDQSLQQTTQLVSYISVIHCIINYCDKLLPDSHSYPIQLLHINHTIVAMCNTNQFINRTAKLNHPYYQLNPIFIVTSVLKNKYKASALSKVNKSWYYAQRFTCQFSNLASGLL